MATQELYLQQTDLTAVPALRENKAPAPGRPPLRLVPRPGPRVVVVGDEGLAEHVGARAGLYGRKVVATLPPPTDPGFSAAALSQLSAFDELVVTADLFVPLRETSPELVRAASSVRLVHPGANGPTDPFQEAIPRFGGMVKRALDIALAATLLLVLAPVLLAAILLIRLDSAGPAFFSQIRLGAYGRPFRIYKLRTMYHRNDDSEHRRYLAALMEGTAERHDGMFKLTSDSRITRVGRQLRRFSLDEVPQLWNVLRGDMSLVGPRPPLPSEAEGYSPQAWQRLAGRPGLTGSWQVQGRCLLPFDTQVLLDLEYWQQWSLAKDLSIVARTPLVVVTGRGAA